ncbi:multicopper oxidase family protein [Vannielia litorea]|uniref:multicopper oxidase family protein n=1 Tax=Vannielia litorea TaxID=1217970 RepID=UPI001FD0D4E7|nr:multicopper oxidase family protein [Vannielia litorea]
MNITRRNVLLGGAATAALPIVAAAETPADVLPAVATDVQMLPEGYGKTRVWSYGGVLPGEEIRVPQGGRVRRRLVNDLDQATSTHWHGIRIDNAMDGVSGLTQEAVVPGASFDYDFVVPDAGTYWYHAHNRSFEQVARGLYGALIVEEREAPDVDREEVLILDDWLIDPETAQLAGDFGAPHDLSHAGRLGNFITTNGQPNLTLQAKRHERLRLRLLNASNARIFQLQLSGMEGWLVALDGMPLREPQTVREPIVLGPAQRADVVVDITADSGEVAHVVWIDGSNSYSQVAFEVRDGGTRSRRDAILPLPPNSHGMPLLSASRPLTLRMEGGAMGGLREARMNGEMQSMGDLAAAGQFWAFNGAVGGMEGPPLAEVAIGETLRLTIVNDTVFPHAMHLHGMHFHEILPDGSLGAHRDTTMLVRGETRDIAFLADNPGDWLLHCHMLSHAASGMMTWIRVT